MKILVLSPHIPLLMAGASTRDYHIVKALASKHEVTVLTLNQSQIEGVSYNLGDLPNLVQRLQVIEEEQSAPKRWGQLSSVLRGTSYVLNRSLLPEMQRAIDEAVGREHYDAILCESVMLAGYRFPPEVLLVIDQHNLEYELCWRTYKREKFGLRKLYNWLEARKLQPEELKRCREARLVFVTSERERIELKRQLPQCVIETVPNGVDTTFFQPAPLDTEVKQRVVFTGSMDYYPNTDAALYFAERCWPLIKARLPEATWTIVGKNPPTQIQGLAELPGVTVTGSVLDVRPYLEEAAVAIAPILVGSGTRLKILEAFAKGKPVVSTSLGCEGLRVEHGRELLIADSPVAFAEAVIELLENEDTRHTLGLAGRSLVEVEYSWEECGRRLLRALEKIQP